MDLGRARRELRKSVVIAWTDERWVPVGAVLAVVATAAWVGLTAGALLVLAPAVDISLALDPWTGTTTGLAVAGALLWVVAPAAVLAVLADRRIRNQDGKLRLCYRLRHPTVLLVPPAVVLAVAVGIVAGALAPSPIPEALLVVAAALFLLRTVAYGYRVVSLSYPALFQASLFAGTCLLAVTGLAAGATGIGYGEAVAAVGAGLAETTGIPSLSVLAAGTVTVAGTELAALPVAAAVTMTVLSAGYLTLQFLAGLVLRVRKPTVPRSHLRSGQRFPAFLTPTATSRTRASADDSREGSPDATGGQSVPPPGSPTAGTDGGAPTAEGGPGTIGSSDPTDRPTPVDPAGGSGTLSDETPLEPETTDDSPPNSDDSPDAVADEPDDVSHTRVFSPERDLSASDRAESPLDDAPSGRQGDDPAAGADDERVSGAAGLHCPACAASYDADLGASFCPDCGARLESD